jgi:cobalamin biosynthetic protein CobC
MTAGRDHGGGLDAAVAQYGGVRADWLDLSTGINPVPYPVGEIGAQSWSALPDRAAMQALEAAARQFWQVPDGADIVAANGASALIARMPDLTDRARVHIPGPTYNEHAAAFRLAGRVIEDASPDPDVHVYVHPNNPDGHCWDRAVVGGRALTVIDESFCDTDPDQSHIARTRDTGVVVLKSFGKFWGLAGLRLGFAVAAPALAGRIRDLSGPWSVSGPALQIGARALRDTGWANDTRARLAQDAARLDRLLTSRRAEVVGGTTLFRLYRVDDAAVWQDRLAQRHVWSRIFPYSRTWLRLGLPHPDRWDQLEAAI